MSSTWMLGLVVVVVGLGCSFVPAANGYIEDYHEKWLETIESMTSPPDVISIKALSCKGIQFDTTDGTCSLDTPPEPATSVHLLTPGDIGIVGAIGDSITAGFGAKASNIFDSPTREARGVSWCIGGDELDYSNCATIPNILRSFNSDVYGASTGYGDEGSQGANLNRAVSGAESKDILSQAENLVNRIRQLSVEQQEQWKLVTLWIGGNDLCKHCGGDAVAAETYYNNILNTLKYLKENLPKTLVNVPQTLDITKITDTTGLICGVVHWFACDCASSSETSELARDYMDKIDQLDDLSELNDGDEFAVVVQPFFKEIDLPRKDGKVDMSFFAPDCFHMSTLGHRAITAGLWNNMVSDKEHKETNWDPYDPVLKCPNPAHPYFYTSRTQSLLDARSNNGDGGFNAQSLPGQDEGNEDTTSNKEDGWSLGQIFGVTIGVTATAYVAVVSIGVGIGATVWARRRRRARLNGEAIPLVKQL